MCPEKMDQMQKTHYQKACIVICGDVMEDWRYVFRELKMRVGVSAVSTSKFVRGSREVVASHAKARFKGRSYVMT